MDIILTENLRHWLDTDPTNRNIEDGAKMLLQLNRNRFLYNSIIKKPKEMAKKLEYELQKHLRIRLDNLTVSQVAELDSIIFPAVEKVLSENSPVITTDNEFPDAKIAKGRRDDHDTLPKEIQALWDNNLLRLQTIKQTFEQLKTMSKADPCDRYEYLKVLDEAEKAYRKSLELYDSFTPAPADDKNAGDDSTSETKINDSDIVTSTADVVNSVNAARKFISKNKKELAVLVGAKDKKANALKSKIQECVKIIQTSGTGFSKKSMTELSELGIIF